MSDWIPFKQIDWDDETKKSFHVDTRDFHVSASKSSYLDVKKHNTDEQKYFPVKRIAKDNKRLFSKEEVIELLERLYKESGERVTWRFLSLVNYKAWLKYIRIYRLKEGFFICGQWNDVLNKHKLNSKVEKQY